MYRPRHARPALLSSRTAVTGAVTGLLLPALPVVVTTATPAQAAYRADTTATLSVPRRVRPGRVAMSVRLLADGRPVRNGVVDVQRRSGGAWRTVVRVPTDGRGIGRTALRLTRDTRLRAWYRGAPVRRPDAGPTRYVDVRRASRPVVRASASSSAVLREASRHAGKPYRYGATGPSSFDCSGFTGYVFKRVGKSLPRTSRAQEAAARRVSKGSARPGDLVFIQDVRGHVGIYAGGGRMWDAPRPGKSVSLRRIWTPNYTVGRV